MEKEWGEVIPNDMNFVRVSTAYTLTYSINGGQSADWTFGE